MTAPRTRGKNGNDPIDAAYLELMELCEAQGKQFVKAKEFAEQIADGRLAMIQAVQIVIDLLKPRRGARMTVEEATESLENERTALLKDCDGIDEEIERLRVRKAGLQREARRIDHAMARLTGSKRVRASGGPIGANKPVTFEGRKFSAGDMCPFCNDRILSEHAAGRLSHLRPCRAKHPNAKVA